MTTPMNVIIDTDPGLGEPGSDIDDGLAIALALRSPELNVLGLTIVNGNVDATTGVDVARLLTARLGRPELPVLMGASEPLHRTMSAVQAMFAAGLPNSTRVPREPSQLLGPTHDQPAHEWMIDAVAQAPGTTTVIAIGPMTNVALAIQRDPSFAANVKELVLMAGSATTYAQNLTVVGDFNAYVDPDALDIVIRSGARIRMVGLDQTSQVVLTRTDVDQLNTINEAAEKPDQFTTWTAQCTQAWIDFLGQAFPHRPEHQDGCFLHDPLVVAATIDPTLCRWENAHVQVETVSDLARGLVVADRGLALQPMGPPNASVAVETDVERFRTFFLSRISTAPAPSSVNAQ
jgi:inosine-uridine nucleoside N-ribohydrolase